MKKERDMLKVGIICAYFGKLPGSYGVWLRSCELNSTIDFFLITDQKTSSLPANVQAVNMSFKQVQNLVNNQLKTKVSLDYPYKLCDLKPMYGLIFRDLLKGYDYWGHCDMDMVFGDLQSFFSKYCLEKYDKFLDLGHLSLYRNTQENNQRFKQSGSECGDWLTVVSDPEGHAFDEWGGIYKIFKKNNYPTFDKRIYADISSRYKRMRCALEDVNYDKQIFYWGKGKTCRDFWLNGEKNTEGFIYIHFQKRDFNAPNFAPERSNGFFILTNGFFEKGKDATLEDVDMLNPFRGQSYEQLKFCLSKMRDMVRKIKRRARKIRGEVQQEIALAISSQEAMELKLLFPKGRCSYAC